VVCNNGRQSAKCAEALVQRHGFAEVYLLVGGMLRWVAEARPIARKPTYKVASADR
jgi:rhodanese-related sulfurtransferase